MSKHFTEAGWPAVAECFSALCKGVDSPFSLKAYILLINKEFEQLLSLRVNPAEYCDAYSFSGDYAVANFLRKNPDVPFTIDKKAVALAAFESSESLCKETNLRVRSYLNGDLKITRSVNEVIHLAQRKIARLLREGPSLIQDEYSWGPGATYDLRRSKAYPDSKLVDLPFTVTGSAWKHAATLINSDLHWKEAIIAANPTYQGPIFKIVPGGRYDTVRKTAKTDRSIIVEPRLNTLVQKTLGNQIRVLLSRVGIDLEDQSRNQCLAELACSLDLATLDLEAASDSISRAVVELLIPPEWYDLLDDCRSKWVEINGSARRLEKFSSMGNGFTFELETLIFWSITSAVSELTYHSIYGVYGDDIILHRDCVPLILEVFDFLGFKLNSEKSFTSGAFFESCGKHYFWGTDVTPAYQKCSPVSDDEAARMGNRILRLADRLGANNILDKRIMGAWHNWFRRWNPDPIRCGPFIGEGDGYWETFTSHYSNRTRYGPFGSWCKVACYSPSVQEIPAIDEAMYALWLMQSSKEPFQGSPMKGIKDAISQLHSLPEPKVSFTGTVGKVRRSSMFADIGRVQSRVKPRTVTSYRNVLLGHKSTNLAW